MSAVPGDAPEPTFAEHAPVVAPTSVVAFHALTVRPSEDDAGAYVVGRPIGGEFVLLPSIGVDAIRLLDGGLHVHGVEERLADGGDPPDVADFVASLADLGFVAAIDGRVLPEHGGGAAGEHLRWLKPPHVRWLFAGLTKSLYVILVAAALWAIWRQPGLVPSYRDFFWTRSVGLVVLVNTLAFVASAVVHELMHLAAARSLGIPARIGFGTRLNNLVLQTDVSAAWTVPRRMRYRIYLAGLYWDTAAICTALLLIAYTDLSGTVEGLLGAYVLVVALSMTMQIQVYMRTDLYFVLQDLLRCRDLFHDGLAYTHFLLARVASHLRLRRDPLPDPARELPQHERRAVRIYAPLLVLGSTVALAVYALYGAPILVMTAVRAGSAVAAASSGGSLFAAVDGAVVLLVEATVQVIFLLTFYRNRRVFIKRVAARFRWRKRVAPSCRRAPRHPTRVRNGEGS